MFRNNFQVEKEKDISEETWTQGRFIFQICFIFSFLETDLVYEENLEIIALFDNVKIIDLQ